MRTEGDFGVLRMKDCENIRIFGLSGNIMASRGYSFFSIEHCRNFLLTNIATFYKRLGRWGALGTAHSPELYYRVTDNPGNGKPEVKIPVQSRLPGINAGILADRNWPGLLRASSERARDGADPAARTAQTNRPTILPSDLHFVRPQFPAYHSTALALKQGFPF